MSVGERLREVRGMRTLEEFSKLLGVKGSNISSIENGRSKMSLDLAEKICEVYGCTMDWLVRGIGTRDGSPPKVEEEQGDYVKVHKDELIQLQRQAIRNKDERIEDLLKQVQTAKNIEGADVKK